MRDRLEHHLAIGAQDDAKHAVGGRVLRPHVDEHFLGGHVVLLDAIGREVEIDVGLGF
ncbi:MAG: hypothetical protein IPK83_02090 [Planctomycetes bacterium]|nr:hypothetical protein [Planctomycetota bacterium]